MKYNYVYFNTIFSSNLKVDPDEYNYICVTDLRKLDNVQVVDIPLEHLPLWTRWLYRIHNSGKINRIVNLPFKHLWDKYYFRCKFENSTKPLCFVFLDLPADPDVLRGWRKKYPGVRFVKVHRDLLRVFRTFDSLYTDDVCKELFDLQVAYDAAEASKNGFLYFGYSSVVDVPLSKNYPLYDVYFAGKANRKKGRLDNIIKAYDKLSSAGLNCNFLITHCPVEDRQKRKGIVYSDKLISYREMLYNTANARCVLEIVQDGTLESTSRFVEALAYNKKLITNSMKPLKTRFYNPEYIQCVKDVDDIDPSFVMKDVGKIDYHYNNEFSPVHLLELIDENL